MKHVELFKSVLEKYKMASPVPVPIRRKIGKTRQKTYRAIFKKVHGLTPLAGTAIRLVNLFSIRGKSMTLKGSVRFMYATVGAVVVLLVTGIGLYVTSYRYVDSIKTAKTAIVIFSVGDVVKISNNTSREKLKVKDVLHVGEKIQTGKNAMVSLQVENIGVFRVGSNSQVTLNAILGINKKTEVFLHKGSVFSKIHKLQKDAYQVKTHSCLAAVRGTEFLTRYNAEKKQTTIELLTGKVDVVPVQSKDSHKILSEKNRAEVGTAQQVTITPLSELRQLQLKRHALHVPIKNITEKNDNDFREIFQNIKKQEEAIDKQIKSLMDQTQTMDQLSPIEILKRRGLPVTMFHLSNGTKLAGSIVSRSGDSYTVDSGLGIIKIPRRQIRRMEIVP